MKKATFLLFFCIVLNCVTTRHVTLYQEPGFDLVTLQNEKIAIYASGIATSTNWPKSFQKSFQDSKGCSMFAARAISHTLDSMGFTVLLEEDARNVHVLAGGSAKEDINEFLQNAPARFIYYLCEVVIYEEKQYNPGHMALASGTGGGMMMTGGSSQTVCHAKVIADIYDRESLKKVFSYETTDRETVFMFAFGGAMKGALKSASRNAAKYLTGAQ